MTDIVPADSRRIAAPEAASKVGNTARIATFPDHSARELLMLRAWESLNEDDAQDDHPQWTRADALWATKVASETVGPQGSAQAFLSARAHAAMQRLAPRDEGVRRALALRGWRWSLLPIAALIALVVGALAYDLGSNRRIDLLSLPVWVVVLWNLLVYVGLLVAWFKGMSTGKPAFGWLRTFIGKRFAARVNASPRKAPALANFARQWSQASWPMTVARAGSVLHVAAAALALGLVAGMYLRGLVLDYRAGWESTFLEPPAVHRVLKTVLAPASMLSAVPLPDEAGVAALRLTPGQEAKGEAASWIHLYAATLVIFVVLPRLLLALGSVLRGAWLSRKFPLPIDEPYHQRLLQQHGQQHGGSVARVRVHPHGNMPAAPAALAMQKLVARVLGDRAELDIAALASYGQEDQAGNVGTDRDTLKLALFDLSATPEVEAQGRFVEALKAKAARGTSLVVMVDEASFATRFGATGERIDQRRRAWRDLLDKLQVPAVFVNLEAPQIDVDARALDAAITRAGSRS